ncbi:MAG: NotI family restriction endonuclease [Thermodesulfobacteriota bacterium]|nr:NotI family restriction endonuclease [Thermodesulfobacteriota bacterium]
MAKHPAEVFGYPIGARSAKAKAARRSYWCPFVDEKCNKQSRLVRYPMGVCSVQYGNQVVALSPRRFLQDNTVFKDIADHHFKTRDNLLLFSEVGLAGTGNFDFVMVKHKPLSSHIEDFVIIEFQTGQTTSTGKLVQALKDYLRGKDVKGKSYAFGLNMADIWKRSFTQILNKGIVLEKWGHKIYWVVQEPVYQNLLDRYNLNGMGYRNKHTTVFAIYDLKSEKGKYNLFQTRIESSTIDNLFEAFRNNPNIPPKDAFVDKLQTKLRAKMQLKLNLA